MAKIYYACIANLIKIVCMHNIFLKKTGKLNFRLILDNEVKYH